jgi:hypothetical protein
MIYSAFVKINDISMLSIGYNLNEIGEITMENFNKNLQFAEWKQIVFLDFFWKGIIGTFNELLYERTKTVEKMIVSILFKESHSILHNSLKVCTSHISTPFYDAVHNIISIYSTGIYHTNDCIKTQIEIQISYIQSKHNAIFNTFMNRMNITIHSAVNIFRVGVSIGCSSIIYFYCRKRGHKSEVKQNHLITGSKTDDELYDIENKSPVSKRRKRVHRFETDK